MPKETVEYAKELYLHHLTERWQLIRYYILIYSGLFAGELGIAISDSCLKKEVLSVAGLLGAVITLLLFCLDFRIGWVIASHREELKEAEAKDDTVSRKIMVEACKRVDGEGYGRKVAFICRNFTTGRFLTFFFLLTLCSQIFFVWVLRASLFDLIMNLNARL
jgi:hypothetical protein